MLSVLCQMLCLQNNVPKKSVFYGFPLPVIVLSECYFFPILHNVMTVEGVITLAR